MSLLSNYDISIEKNIVSVYIYQCYYDILCQPVIIKLELTDCYIYTVLDTNATFTLSLTLMLHLHCP